MNQNVSNSQLMCCDTNIIYSYYQMKNKINIMISQAEKLYLEWVDMKGAANEL